MKSIHSNIEKQIISLVIMTIGCFIFAIGFNIFVFPNHLFTGGVTGISLIIYELFHISPPYTQWALNIPMFFVGWLVIGNEYATKIIFGSLFLPLTIKVTENLSSIHLNLSIYASLIFGGIFLGLGLGTILAVNGSTGGLDIPARILSRTFRLSLGKAIAAIDSIVIITGMYVYQKYNNTGLEKGLYALILLLIMMIMIDLCTKDKYMQFFKNKFKKY